MGDIQRHGPKEAIIPKRPDTNAVIWQASDGSLYALSNSAGFNEAIKAEYGEKWARKVAGIVSKEALDAVFSVVRTNPTAGVASYFAVAGIKIVAKGTSSNIKDAISGTPIDLKTIGANYGKELLKASNYAPTDPFANPTRDLNLNTANGLYKYKKFITSNDPGISKIQLIKIEKINSKQPDYLIKGDIGGLSIGKTAEGTIINFVAQKLNHKPKDEQYYKIDLGKYAENWDSIDIENFERFVNQGYTIEEAVAFTNRRDKNLVYDINQFAESFKSSETNIFTTAKNMGYNSLDFHWDRFLENSKKSNNAFAAALANDFKPLAAGGRSIVDLLLAGVDIIGIGLLTPFEALGQGVQGIVGSAAKSINIVNDLSSANSAGKKGQAITVPPSYIDNTQKIVRVRPDLTPQKGQAVRQVTHAIKVTNERKEGEKVVVNVQTQAPVIKRSNSYLQPQSFDASRTILQLR